MSTHLPDYEGIADEKRRQKKIELRENLSPPTIRPIVGLPNKRNWPR